jgi:hypothetical protein
LFQIQAASFELKFYVSEELNHLKFGQMGRNSKDKIELEEEVETVRKKVKNRFISVNKN